MPDPVRMQILIPPELHEWLRREAYESKTSIASLVREAVQRLREEREGEKS